jgi:hypothetical protein
MCRKPKKNLLAANVVTATPNKARANQLEVIVQQQLKSGCSKLTKKTGHSALFAIALK